MAFPIIPKKRSGATGSPTSLTVGELAVNTATGELFLGGDESVLLLNPPTAAGTTATEATGDGTTTAFTFSGYNGTADGGYLVSVGGIDQPPSKYAVTSTAGGTITFVEAPIAGEIISIRALVASSGGGGTNATQLQGVDIAATTPTDAQYLVYNAANSRWEPFSGETYNVQALLVAGGGGTSQAGGGAGGVYTATLSFTTGQILTIVVGAGGTGTALTAIPVAGSNSQISLDATVLSSSIGGGYGGQGGSPNGGVGGNGGSGGGGGGNGLVTNTTIAGGSGTVGQGNDGGSTPGLANSPCGGGGGAGAVGANGAAAVGGNGGAGIASSITGASVFYGGGGGGSVGSGTQGTGGIGGGGNATAPRAGTANLGGGGGGANGLQTGGNGGSGTVILSIPASNYSGVTTGSPVVTFSGSNVILRYTSSGAYLA